MATLLCAAERLRMAVCRLIESSKSKAPCLPRNSVPAQPCCCCVQLAGGVLVCPVVVRTSCWCGGQNGNSHAGSFATRPWAGVCAPRFAHCSRCCACLHMHSTVWAPRQPAQCFPRPGAKRWWKCSVGSTMSGPRVGGASLQYHTCAARCLVRRRNQ